MMDKEMALRTIKQVLLELGICPTLMGYEYLVECIYLCLEEQDRIHDIIHSIYEVVAEEHHTTYPRVERNIRHLIKVFADCNRIDNFNNLLHIRIYKPYECPANGEFIAYLAEYFRMHYDFDPDDLT